MKKIMLIHTGGTFGMVPMKPSNTLAPSLIQDQILTHVPEIQKIADIDFDVVFNLDSSNIQIHHWQKLAQYIYERYSDYDGFVIIHGTDAMIYTASALSYMLRGIGKPVVLTGSQRPLAQIRSDARSNLINSMELATYPIPEVSIFFDTHLFRGNRTIKISSTQYDAFASPNYPSLAEVGLDIKLSKSVLMHPAALEFHRQLDPRVFCFRFFPGLQTAYLEYLLNSPVQGVVIEALGVGNLAIFENSVIPWIRKFSEAGKIVVIGSQSPFGRVDLQLYECGKMVKEAGGISSGDMTISAALVKLMFLLGKYPGDGEKIKREMELSLAGEITRQED